MMLVSLPFALLILLDFVTAGFNASSESESESGIRSAAHPPPALQEQLVNWPALRRRAYSPENATSTILPLVLNDDRSSYFTIIQVGYISFRVAADTASSDFWLISSACSNSAACKSSPKYPLGYHSPSFGVINNNKTTFRISFADDTSSSGFLASEAVQLGNLSTASQVFGLANSTDVRLGRDISGVLGLGFPRLSTFASLVANSTPFVNGLAQEGALEYPLFGISLTRDDSGTLSVGAVDANVVQNLSAIEWHKVMPFSPFGNESDTATYLQWVVRLPAVGVNGTNVETQPTYANITEQSLALIDIGTNGIFGPYQDVSRLFELVEGARLVDTDVGQWAVPCDTRQVLTLNFGQGNFTLQPTDFLIGPVSGNPSLCLAWPRAVQESGDGIDWQLGTPFLQTVYSIFSFGIDGKEIPMIGFYPLSNVTTLAENGTAISSFFASASTTVATTLPNSLLSIPNVSTPTYIFNTSVPATAGALVSAALGDGNYSAILTADTPDATNLPLITPPPTLVTLIVTDQSGALSTSLEHVSTSSIALGVPPGESSATNTFGHLPVCVLVASLGFVFGVLLTS